jgi:eukaryotic-like serine/threonine-protein kinase
LTCLETWDGGGEARLRVDRYVLYDAIASGGMATIHVGRRLGANGFSRIVAVKRLHPAYVRDRDFAAMFRDEAMMAARLRHPNVVPIHDVVHRDDELFLVMEYIEGESLWQLLRSSREQGERVPVPIAVAIVIGVLHGLHAAHQAKNDRGEPLGLVHRDVSPQNILVGLDGTPRVLDFGIAKARGRSHQTLEGRFKGKLGYMAPEQLGGDDVTCQADIYAAAVVLWEMLAGRRRFDAPNDVLLLAQALEGAVVPPSCHRASVTRALDELVLKALSRRPEERFESARDFAHALEREVSFASATHIGSWVEEVALASLSRRAQVVAKIESQPRLSMPSRDSSECEDEPTIPVDAAPQEPEAPCVASDAPTTTTLISPPTRARRGRVLFAYGIAIAALGGALLVPAPEPHASLVRTPRAAAVDERTFAPPPPSAVPSAVPSANAPSARKPWRAPRGPAAKDDCDNFTKDAGGVRRFTPRCL